MPDGSGEGLTAMLETGDIGCRPWMALSHLPYSDLHPWPQYSPVDPQYPYSLQHSPYTEPLHVY